jgi:hypothetical protein
MGNMKFNEQNEEWTGICATDDNNNKIKFKKKKMQFTTYARVSLFIALFLQNELVV